MHTFKWTCDAINVEKPSIDHNYKTLTQFCISLYQEKPDAIPGLIP
jgi:hypothetical protein